MEDKDLNLEEVAETKETDTVDTTDIDTVEETESVDDTEEQNEVPLYLVVEENGKVVDLSFEDGVFYQNVSEDIDIELVKSELGIGEHLYWDGYLYVKEVDWNEENDKLKNEIQVLKQTIVTERKSNEEQMLELMELIMGMI